MTTAAVEALPERLGFEGVTSPIEVFQKEGLRLVFRDLGNRRT